ncbi:Na+/H+ antiporter subunit E [Pseudalkalibacillus berkeleyi]|uniref:Na+/H+ antiporter subunit E n=1 Tax=Pseudalkalibacillus berkeleyi TaxID=1069813 RepID=A0ABS9H269_9BACL|nr:Na+/H+ antiporter subunit E [Pseudalkalibacillus berkeleyi]MCF6138006.1 Na+/H+ antiporter subunit E [Pseudalkalibacillus berkeleyi]
MAFQLLINLAIGLIWMFLTESYEFVTFLIGFIIGVFLLFLLNRFIPDTFYFKYVLAIWKLILLFAKELLIANIDVLKMVYRPKIDMQPGIVALPTDLRSNWEITLLANLITLTPGTLSVDVSADNNFIYIHAMDLPDVDETINQIKGTFESAIKDVTR